MIGLDPTIDKLNKFVSIGQNRDPIKHAKIIIDRIKTHLKGQSKAFKYILAGEKIAG